MTKYFGEFIHSQTINTRCNLIQLNTNMTIKTQTYRGPLIPFLYTITGIPVSHSPNIYSSFCSGIWCPLADADSVSWRSEPSHTYLTKFLPASVFLLQHWKKNGLFNSNCSAETLSTRTSTAIIKLVLTPSHRTFLSCNCHESSPNKVGIFLLCLIKSMQSLYIWRYCMQTNTDGVLFMGS